MINFKISTIKKLVNSKKSTLINKAKALGVKYRGKNVKNLILDILQYISDTTIVNETVYDRMDKEYLTTLLGMKKAQLKAEAGRIEDLKPWIEGKTRKRLLNMIIENVAESVSTDHFDPEFFSINESSDEFKYVYDDPHMIREEKEDFNYFLMKELDKHVNVNVAGIIADFVTAPEGERSDKQPLETHTFEHFVTDIRRDQFLEKRNHKRWHSGLSSTGHDHEHHDGVCKYNECVNVMKKSYMYDVDVYGGSARNSDTSELVAMQKLSKSVYGDMAPVASGFNKAGDHFNFVNGWYSQVHHMDSNSFKPAVIKMREMIIEKYASIIPNIKFGAIHDEEKFQQLLAGLDDNDIGSLEYLQFLLSTPYVYFINNQGRIVYDCKFTRNYQDDGIALFPGMYKAFFLIEQNSDGSVQISPVNFGILANRTIPKFQKFRHVKATKVTGMIN